ncbi:MAG: IS630 family transposase [Paraglaciecola polaris]|uniref:IS630 family transposase n=1 Tax=Paraglaciecola polaris TaxID=222814 RepID=UPI003001DB40
MESNARKRLRLLAISHFIEGKNRTEIALILKVSRRSVNTWVSNYLSDGVAGLEAKKAPGRSCPLATKQREQLFDYIDKHSRSSKGGRLTGEAIRLYIADEYQIAYHPNAIYKRLHLLGFSWITSRSKHPKQSQEAQDEFKKTLQIETINRIPGHIALDKVDYWFQDEARIGQQNTTTRLWAHKGTRPRAVKQQQFDYAYLFGAICPSTGRTEAIIAPWVNRDIMRQHLELISAATESGCHAVVIMDGAGWHTDDIAKDIPNLSIIKLPPYSPELNPIEQVWSWLRQHHLANRSFESYDDILEACTTAWNDFVNDLKRVTQMCHRDWLDVSNT